MDPRILVNFNKIIYDAYGENAMQRPRLHIYGNSNKTLAEETNARINGDWARYPLIARVPAGGASWFGSKSMAYHYQLQWFQ